MKTILQTLFFLLLVTQIIYAQWYSQNHFPTRNSLTDISFVNDNVCTIVGNLGTIVHTTNGGESWKNQESGTTDSLFSVSFSDPEIGTVVEIMD